jgi:spermidine/putrescine transport system permease protein
MRPDESIEMHYGEPLTTRGERVRAGVTLGPGLFWLTLFLLVPLLGIMAISFFTRGEYGQLEWPLTLEPYRRLIGFGQFGFDPLYPVIILRSLLLSLATALRCALAGFPLAYFIVSLPGRSKHLALTLVMIPFWTNLMIRTYAWQLLLSPESWITRTAVWLGWLPEGAALYPGLAAVYCGMICDFLPFMVLPLYASLEKLDWSEAEAAMDLGAGPWRVFRHAILPQTRPGLSAGFILVWLPATGQFVIPDLLGGAKTFMLRNAIRQQFGPSRDWPFGSAIAVLTLLVVLVGLGIYNRWSAGKQDWEVL